MDSFPFTDLLNEGAPIRVIAEISFIRPESGGHFPKRAPYRPNHNFGEPENREFYIGQIEIPANTEIYPGEAHKLPITFLSGPGLSELLKPGCKWRIQEGPNLVAIAQVISVQDDV